MGESRIGNQWQAGLPLTDNHLPKKERIATTEQSEIAPTTPTGGNFSISENFAARSGIDNNSLKKSVLNVKMEEFAANNVNYPTVYIPANKRHDEIISRYDLTPVTNREKGDPDRYRAVNPKYVQLEADGNRYYRMELLPDSRHYVENPDNPRDVIPRGIFTRPEIKVDFSRYKEIDGVRYVGVDTGGYILLSALKDANRDNTVSLANVSESRAFRMTLAMGEHQLYDGTGLSRGRIAATSVRLNYAVEKEINGERYLYAFATQIDPNNDSGTETKAASGWIKASAIVEGERPYYSAADVERIKNPPRPSNETVYEPYEITGGNPTASKFGYFENGEFVSYKVLPRIPKEENVAATDYLLRSDGVINLCFNVAGASNDTFRVNSDTPMVFRRSSGEGTTATIDLYHPKDATQAGDVPVEKMTFVYGYVETPGGNRWGWLPLDAITPKTE